MLNPAERFMLWAMRAWVQCCKAKALPATAVESAFAEIGLPDAAGALDDALRAVAHTTSRPLLVHCPDCPGLSDDEWLLLGAAAATQHHAIETAHLLLGEITHPGGAERILASLSKLGLILAFAGIDLPEPDAAWAPHVSGSMLPSPATVH